MPKHDIHLLQNGFEKRCGDARTMKDKSFDVSHVETRLKPYKWADILILDFRKIDVYAIF